MLNVELPDTTRLNICIAPYPERYRVTMNRRQRFGQYDFRMTTYDDLVNPKKFICTCSS